MWPFQHPNANPVLRNYQDKTPRRPARQTPLAGQRLVALDLETSGFKVGSDLVLSVGAVVFECEEIQLTGISHWIVLHERTPVNEATAVHGILPSQSGRGEPEGAILESLLGVLEGAMIVGHHVGFDAAMLDHALQRIFGIKLRNPLIDTAHLVMRNVDAFHRTRYSNQRPPTLDEVCTKLGIPITDRHTAAGDAFTTAQLFMFLCAKMRQKLGRPLLTGDLPFL